MSSIQISEHDSSALIYCDRIPSRFEVRRVLQAEAIDGGLGGLRLVEQPLAAPYIKDYDQYEDGLPSQWAQQFDVSTWGVLLAHRGAPEQPLGAAVLAWNTAGVHMLEGRKELAVLWDLRVRPEVRRQGLGTRLLHAAADWARRRGCTQLKIETQNVNVAACHFYARMGCELGAINRFGYAGVKDVADEVMLLWYLGL